MRAFLRGPSDGEPAPWIAAIAALPLVTRGVLALALVSLVTVLDISTGGEVSFSVFYLAPVLFAGAFISRSAGRAMAVVSAAIWGYLEGATGPAYSSPWIVVWNSIVRLIFLVLINELVGEMIVAHEQQRELARTDALTGIPNARVFKERVELEIAQSRRDGAPFSIAYVDLDRFKRVNDELGHSEGDRLLREFATLLVGSVRATDAAARLGGDEFAILMPQTDAANALASVERVNASVAQGLAGRWGVEATFGVMTFHRPPHDFDSALRLADDKMYEAKAKGEPRIAQGTWPS